MQISTKNRPVLPTRPGQSPTTGVCPWGIFKSFWCVFFNPSCWSSTRFTGNLPMLQSWKTEHTTTALAFLFFPSFRARFQCPHCGFFWNTGYAILHQMHSCMEKTTVQYLANVVFNCDAPWGIAPTPTVPAWELRESSRENVYMLLSSSNFFCVIGHSADEVCCICINILGNFTQFHNESVDMKTVKNETLDSVSSGSPVYKKIL